MRRRRVIGRFKRSKQGGWEGEIETLTIKRHIQLVPNDNRATDNPPDFLVILGRHEMGEAWVRLSRGDPPREYLRVRMFDFFGPVSALLFPDAEGLSAQMVLPDAQPSRARSAERG